MTLRGILNLFSNQSLDVDEKSILGEKAKNHRNKNIALGLSLLVGSIILTISLCSHYGLIAKVGSFSHLSLKQAEILKKALEYTGMAVGGLSMTGSSYGLCRLNHKPIVKPISFDHLENDDLS